MNQKYDYIVLGGGIVGTAIAVGLAGKGFSVALIERGGPTITTQVQATPTIKCLNRQHTGCFRARNHVLGGNGHFWGGGLIRPPDLSLNGCLGILEHSGAAAISLVSNFSNVEQRLNINLPPARVGFPIDDVLIGDCDLSEIFVLTGMSRNTTVKQLDSFCKFATCKTLVGADVVSFSNMSKGRNGQNIGSIIINQANKNLECAARKFVIATGAVDSNLMVLAHAQGLGIPASDMELSSHLHDHLSVPIAHVKLSSNRHLKNIVAPHFKDNLVIGHRFELQCAAGWGARGLLHFALQFDELSPYREIKQLLLLRQQRAHLSKFAKVAFPTLAALPNLLMIAWERLFNQRLLLSDDLSVVATLDFESFPHPHNRLQLVGNLAEFEWKITEEDDHSFLELIEKAYRLLAELASKYGLVFEPLSDLSYKSNALDYFHRAATDAYHLGGGLAACGDGRRTVDQNLQLVGTENIFIVSTAVFGRPGVVNPTHTLLALADRFVSQQH